jgi:hypothetical protein
MRLKWNMMAATVPPKPTNGAQVLASTFARMCILFLSGDRVLLDRFGDYSTQLLKLAERRHGHRNPAPMLRRGDQARI